MLGGFTGNMPMHTDEVMHRQELIGLLGLWLWFHGAYPPQFPLAPM
jgi:hypothetical protein